MDDPDGTSRWTKLDDLHVIWNRACGYGADGEAPEGTPLGIVQLSFFLDFGSCLGSPVSNDYYDRAPFHFTGIFHGAQVTYLIPATI